jgi:hypothetical protein
VGKSVGTRPKNARSAKGVCKVVTLAIAVKGAVLVMVALERLAIFVE